jgi:hypothetical protein
MADRATITVTDDGRTLDVNEILTGRGFITGKSGSGKSNTASVIAEELLESGFPILIVDTDGEYYGLKDHYDLLHVGADDRCDRIVGVSDATSLAEEALEENQPIILDVSGFIEETDSHDLIEAVVRELFVQERSVRKPFLLFVEEVHEFMPESGSAGDLGDMLIRIAKRGRKRGLGMVGMSQRPAAVDKDFITQCDWIVWHRLTWDNDTRVVGNILGSDVADTIQELGDGEAYLMTDWDDAVQRVQFRRKRSFDAGATPDIDSYDAEELTAVDADPDDSDGGGDAEAGSEDDDGDAVDPDRLQRDLERKERRIADLESRVQQANGGQSTASKSGDDREEWPDERETYDPLWELGAMIGRLLRWIGRSTVRVAAGARRRLQR